jgi:sugar-specific transcriptional regulator TrmB
MYKIYLHSLGFSDKEAEVYLALNTHGPSPASTLAKRTGLKRTSMYDILNSLLDKNLIVIQKKGAHTYYAIDDVNKILYQQKDRARLAESVVQQLSAEKGRVSDVKVNHYKGEESFRELYEDILRVNPKELMVWIHLDEFYRALDPVREEEWTKERIEKKIWTRLLMQDTPIARQFIKKDPGSCRKTVLLPKKNMFTTTCFLYENNILLFDSRDEITGIRIQHPGFYAMMKQMFEMNWKLFS